MTDFNGQEIRSGPFSPLFSEPLFTSLAGQVLALARVSPHNARLAASGWLDSLWIDAVAGQVQEARFRPAIGCETPYPIAHACQLVQRMALHRSRRRAG